MKNNFKKTISVLLMTCLCLTSSICFISAESIASGDSSSDSYPIKVASVSSNSPQCDLSGKYPVFSWPSEGNKLYALRVWLGSGYSSDKIISVSDLKSCSYKATIGLEAGRYYSYQVVSYESGSTIDWNYAPINSISQPSYSSVSAPHDISIAFTSKSKAENKSKLGEIVQKDNSLTIKWTIDDPSSYSRFEVYRIVNDVKPVKCATVNASKSTNYSCSFRALSGERKYIVAAFPKMEGSKAIYVPSDAVTSPDVPEGYLLDSVKNNFKWTAVTKYKTSLYKKTGGKAYKSVEKGTVLNATGKYSPKKLKDWQEPTWVQVKYNGKTLYVRWSKVNMRFHVTHMDYSWTAKESFANSGKCKSKTKYLIWVSRFTQRTNVFKKVNKKWKLIKVYDCNTGNYYNPTAGGQRYIKGHNSKVVKLDENLREYYFLYSTKFGGSGTFHTRCKWVDTGGSRNSVTRYPTTNGCARLHDGAAKYIYRLPRGTGVVVK